MPKIFLKCPVGTFLPHVKQQLSEDLTSIALKLEKLPDTPYVRSNVWLYINEYAADDVYYGGRSGDTKIISVEVNALKGGLDVQAKAEMIEAFTGIIHKHSENNKETVPPVFIVIRDVEDTDWGIFGKTITLEKLRNPPPDAKPLP